MCLNAEGKLVLLNLRVNNIRLIGKYNHSGVEIVKK